MLDACGELKEVADVDGWSKRRRPLVKRVGAQIVPVRNNAGQRAGVS